jgi:5-aminolevulinate synthase
MLSDALNHASMIHGIRQPRREAHLPPQRPRPISRQLLAAIEPGRPKLVAFESVYSMDGDIAPIGRICDVAERTAP